MKKQLLTILQDVRSRKWRGVAVALLTLASVLVVDLATPQKSSVVGVVWLFAVVAICAVVITDAPRTMRASRSAIYGTIIMAAFWLGTLVQSVFWLTEGHSLVHTKTQRLADGTIAGAELELAPVVGATLLVAVFVTSGIVAYYVGRHRKDVKGVKNRDLFQ
jgi:uncharacterized membrane protein (GlpM family)